MSVQILSTGSENIETKYDAVLAKKVPNVNAPFDVTERLPPPLFCNMTSPANHDAIPPTEYTGVAHDGPLKPTAQVQV
jgi:hypothetical protein